MKNMRSRNVHELSEKKTDIGLFELTGVVNDAVPSALGTDEVNISKPLQLLWDAFPHFGEESTVMMDVHVERFKGNPLGTGIVVSETSARDVLSLDGELCKHLGAIATCANTSLYIRAKAGECKGLFPSSYEV